MMPHTTEMIELTLTVSTNDEAVAVRLAETMARVALGLSAESGAKVTTNVDRFEVRCDHDRDVDEHEVGS